VAIAIIAILIAIIGVIVVKKVHDDQKTSVVINDTNEPIPIVVEPSPGNQIVTEIPPGYQTNPSMGDVDHVRFPRDKGDDWTHIPGNWPWGGNQTVTSSQPPSIGDNWGSGRVSTVPGAVDRTGTGSGWPYFPHQSPTMQGWFVPIDKK